MTDTNQARDSQKASSALVFLFSIFVIWFAIFTIAFVLVVGKILEETSAVSQCVYLEDAEFRACYDASKE